MYNPNTASKQSLDSELFTSICLGNSLYDSVESWDVNPGSLHMSVCGLWVVDHSWRMFCFQPWVSALGGEKRRPLVLKSTKMVAPWGWNTQTLMERISVPTVSTRVKPTHMWNYLNWLQWLNHPNWFSGFCPPTCFRAGNCIKLMKVLKWPFKLCRTFGYLHLLVISTTSIWEYLISHQIKYK